MCPRSPNGFCDSLEALELSLRKASSGMPDTCTRVSCKNSGAVCTIVLKGQVLNSYVHAVYKQHTLVHHLRVHQMHA